MIEILKNMIITNVNQGGYSWIFKYDGVLGFELCRFYPNDISPNIIASNHCEHLTPEMAKAVLLQAKAELIHYIGRNLNIHHTLKTMILENQKQLLLEISEGNPGAISALCELVRCGDKNNKISEVDEYLKMLKVLGVAGTDVYVLFSDICDRDSKKMFIVLWAVRNGHFDATQFSLACSKQDYSGKDIIPVDALVELFNNEGEHIEW